MENPSIDLLMAACGDPGRFVPRRFFPSDPSDKDPGVMTVAEPLLRWQARAVQAAISGLASEEEEVGPWGIRLTRPLRLRQIAATSDGTDLFATREVTLIPGESVTWTYPSDGIKIETDLPVRTRH